MQSGRCLVAITENSKRWILPRRKDRYFDIAYKYRGGWHTPGDKAKRGRWYIGVSLEVKEELTMEEYERRKEVKPEEKVLREATKLINPALKANHNG